jgi:hypothetical protein
MLITKENFVDAIFANDERSIIECLIGNEEIGGFDAISINVDENDNLFKELMQVVTLDDVEKSTLIRIEDTNKAIQDYHIALIEEGKAVSPQVEEEEPTAYVSDILHNIIYGNCNGKVDEEQLFIVKIQAFELPDIMDAPTEIKESIRTAPSLFEVIKITKEYLDSL